MENILNNVGDFEGLFDLPDEFQQDNLLDDLDSLDFINDLEESFIYDCDLLTNNSSGQIGDDIKENTASLAPQNINNYYKNCNYDSIRLPFNNNVTAKERYPVGNNMIRELLSSDLDETISSQRLYTTFKSNNVNDKHSTINAEILIDCCRSDKRNICKRPIILPAATIPSGHMLSTPTLAATLINIKPSANKDNMDGDSSNYGSGKGLRRNSHNAIEKRYRLSINDRIDELRQMLSLGDSSKMNKSSVLRKAIERIKLLEQENNSLKCENYNLKKQYMMTTSNESLNITGSSPSSNQSDISHSVTHSPSSSSMHSTSVTSKYILQKSNDNRPSLIVNANKGVKRPLIYDNSSTPVKTEKLAKLLLSSSESFDNHEDRRLNSSNMPGFLMCTMALFIVSFQPFDIVLNNYRTKTAVITGGRTILQMPESIENVTGGLGRTMLLVCTHWILAFMLVWGSTNNRYLISKALSFILRRVQTMTFITFHYNNIINDDRVNKKLEVYRKDSLTFELILKDNLRSYHCKCPDNIIMFIVQLFAVLCGIVVSYLPFNIIRRRPDKEALKVAMCLVTDAVEQCFIGKDLSYCQSLWYKAVLILIIRIQGCDKRTLWSSLILSQSISFELIRKYFVNKILRSKFLQDGLMSDKYVYLLNSAEMRKIFIKNSIVKVKEKVICNSLMMTITADIAKFYYMTYVQETLALVIKSTEEDAPDTYTEDNLKEIIASSSTFLNAEESSYVNNLCNFLLSARNGNKHQDIEEISVKLMCYYKNNLRTNANEDQSNNDLKQTVSNALSLLLSTISLDTSDSIMVHEMNLNLISSITKTSIENIIIKLIFNMSIECIISSLNGQRDMLSRSSYIIYYVDKYNTLLREYSQLRTPDCGIMSSKLEMLFQEICQVNPMRYDSPNNDNRELLLPNKQYYRVCDFVSRGRRDLREFNDSRMRSH